MTDSTDLAEPALDFAAPDTARETAYSSLGEVDWSFPTRVAHSEIEGIHPYPAKFVAELPRALLEHLPIPRGTSVLDPFCGSGTALVESQRVGIESVGIDLNPIACLMSRVKTQPCPNDLEGEARAVQKLARDVAPSVPSIPNLDHWFRHDIQEELARLTTAIADAPAEVRDCLHLALSSIIVRVSNQESDTRYAAINKDIDAANVGDWFIRAARRISDALSGLEYPLVPARVIEGNTLEITPEQIGTPVGMVITSPPYPNAYEYWLYHKYRMWWLGYDPLSVKEHEIGARAHFFKKNHHTKEHFVEQMKHTFSLLDKVVVRKGFVCFVVGRSRIHGEIINNAEIVEQAGFEKGFVRHFATERVVSANRKSFNLSHANIKTETVLVLRKEAE